MALKATIDKILKDKNRSLSWLAHGIGKTFDGLRLGLLNESVKYKDILLIAEKLEISPCVLFNEGKGYQQNHKDNMLAEPVSEYGDLKANLRTCKELISTLKDQVKDKERIINLMQDEKR
ncbi:hypothetical protein ABIE26_001463 [Pedobacter africanus]|uniref:Uncharacterized protein n=1 Tax=Pedobacter africanus TaxID=151894 RepID=A0ACC6KSC6_9SPHI|nr:hypothetical protein [Pedobacter africanus]MDR6782048.1 hypothetical protein [Pedobacter africanus]